MSFVSIEFFILLLLTWLIYWSLKRRAQNVLLLISSYVFYGWWDWRFLGLIFFSTVVDFLCGLGYTDKKQRVPRKVLLWISLSCNLGLLGFFKYFNFFIESAVHALNSIGIQQSEWSLYIVLPVGISFYTFQTLSYTIDLYRGKMKPVTDFVQFSVFVAFFPQLVAGPIERAEHLLGQFATKRNFDSIIAKDGLRQMLWGFFKKIVIADNVAGIVDYIYADPSQFSGGAIALATVLFAFQIYCDFSGYSDIAIGAAKLLGIDLMRNFAYPYFSRDMAEFWHRWHISLSTWFRDYVYIPLGGSRTSEPRRIFNVITTFTVSGLWHGANWTFVAWGFVNGIMVLFWNKGTTKGDVPGSERLRDLWKIMPVFGATCLAWVFFRAASIGDAVICFKQLFTSWPILQSASWLEIWNLALREHWMVLVIFIVVEWSQRCRHHGLAIAHLPLALRWTIYIATILVIFIFGQLEADVAFIYFQF